MIIEEFQKEKRIHPPSWLPSTVQYMTLMGSQAYGVNTKESDFDIYGFCIPPKEEIFPHLKGEILGFGDLKHGGNRFEQWQEHSIQYQGKEFDFTIYGIVKYFQLVMENNPNMIDSIFTHPTCVLWRSKVSDMIRENRKIFLHKGAWHTFKGYAYQQIKKCKSKEREGKRKEIVDRYGYDIKFAYHCVRLLNEIEQILIEGDLDLMRNNEQLKSIRAGEWTLDQVEDYFQKKEIYLEELYQKSSLPWGPKDQGLQDKVKALLFNCLEEHFGSLDQVIKTQDKYKVAIHEIRRILDANL